MNTPPSKNTAINQDRSPNGDRNLSCKSLFLKWLVVDGPPLAGVLLVAALLRIGLALMVDYLAARRGSRCLFGDTEIYWQYGVAIAEGRPYVIYQWEVPHFALRTPGYPVWLALFIKVLGTSTIWIRLGQAGLGTLAVWWIYKLAKHLGFTESTSRWSAVLLAIDPFQAIQSGFLLTEALFAPLLMLFLVRWVATLGDEHSDRPLLNHGLSNFSVGVCQAVLALIRPAWGPFLVVVLIVNSFYQLRLRQISLRRAALMNLLLIAGWFVVVLPWVVRNEQVIGRAAIGGTWGGASLYDGVRPGADGSSVMSFVASDEFRHLTETEQDDRWKSLSWQEIRTNPERIARLAIAKQARFWSAWPLEQSANRWWLKLACGLVVWPVWLAGIVGLVSVPRKKRLSWAIFLCLPLLFTAMEHTLFVGSSRYRVAVFGPVLILSAEGVVYLLTRLQVFGLQLKSFADEPQNP